MNLSTEQFDQITASINIVGEGETRPADRRAPRLKFNTQVGAMNWSDPEETYSVRIDDLSTGGARLLHTDRISLDQQLVLCLPLGNDQTLSVLCTVMYWEPLSENLFAIGSKFERIVEESELLQRQSEPTMLTSSPGILARLSHRLTLRQKIA